MECYPKGTESYFTYMRGDDRPDAVALVSIARRPGDTPQRGAASVERVYWQQVDLPTTFDLYASRGRWVMVLDERATGEWMAYGEHGSFRIRADSLTSRCWDETITIEQDPDTFAHDLVERLGLAS